MKLIRLFCALCSLVLVAQALETNTISFTNQAGHVVLDAPIRDINETRILYKSQAGLEAIDFDELPDGVAEKYRPAKAPLKNEIKIIPKTEVSLFARSMKKKDEFDGHLLEIWVSSTISNNGIIFIFLTRSAKDDTTVDVQHLIWIEHRTKDWMFLEDKGDNLMVLADGEAIVLSSAIRYKSSMPEEKTLFICKEDQTYEISKEQFEKLLQTKEIKLRLNGTQHRFDYILNSKTVPDAPYSNMPKDRTGPYFEVLKSVCKVTEKNNQWWRWSYQVTVRNNDIDTSVEDVKVQLLDRRGFVIDHKTEYKIVVSAGQVKVVPGFLLVDSKIAGNVASVRATWSR